MTDENTNFPIFVKQPQYAIIRDDDEVVFESSDQDQIESQFRKFEMEYPARDFAVYESFVEWVRICD